METTPVNWEALDSLVIDFAKSENLINTDSLSESSSSYQSRLVILRIRRLLESGDIDSSIDLIRSHAPFLLNDHRLLFRLQKQKFIELLRRGTEDARDSAVECIRTALAPCALDAYPEAFEEFKHVLLAFIYDKDDGSSPIANEWSERRRLEIAGLISSVLRAHLQAYDPIFSMTLKYLISIHKAFCFRQGFPSPISDLTERLLLEERDPPAVPQESLYEAPPFDEVDIQALAHAVELTRQGAVDSLRFSKGNLFQAFQNELCRMKLDVNMLDELVRDYCVYRGIVDIGSTEISGSRAASGISDGEASISDAVIDHSTESNMDAAGAQGHDVELRCTSESTSSFGDCSTSNIHLLETRKNLQRSRNFSSGERGKRKRWRGRQVDDSCSSDISFIGYSKEDVNTGLSTKTICTEQQYLERHPWLNVNNKVDKYDILLGIKELASSGMAAEVVEEMNVLDSNFFAHNPVLLFQLKQVEFLKLVNTGDHSKALEVASTYLGPLAASNSTLLKPLKETLLALLQPNEDVAGKDFPLNSLANSLQVAIGKRVGIEEPQLMKIMRAAIHTHTEWFKLQMCKDQFESLLKIDSLKAVDAPLLSTCSMTKSNADSFTQGSSQVTVSSSNRVSEDGSSPTPVSSRDVVYDENAILKVMEFLALPRADAIHLLAQYNGNAETVIQQIFA